MGNICLHSHLVFTVAVGGGGTPGVGSTTAGNASEKLRFCTVFLQFINRFKRGDKDSQSKEWLEIISPANFIRLALSGYTKGSRQKKFF